MSAPLAAEGRRRSRSRPEVFRRPPQGWSSLLIFLAMLAIVGLSIADARPLLIESADRTASLVVAMLAAGLIGFVVARSSLGIVRSHVLGAAAGAVILVLIVGAAADGVGNVLPTSFDELTLRMQRLSEVLEADVERWVQAQVPGTVPVTATLLVLGAICWTTGQFGAFSIFRYDRGGPAVMATGILLFLNVATRALGPGRELLPVIPVLAAYSALAMLLLIRMQLTQQGEHWARRHIADTGEVGRLFLRSGALFVALAVVGASSLTAMAVARPPNIDFRDLEGPLEDLGADVSRWLGIFAINTEPTEPTVFGSEFTVASEWDQGPGVAFTATVTTGLRDNYWWGSAFDRFDGRIWSQTDRSEAQFAAEEALPIPAGSSPAASVAIEAVITPQRSSLARGTVLGPAEAAIVSRAVTVRNVGRDDGLADITFHDDVDTGESYRVSSFVHDYRSESATLSGNQLRAAGTDYPDWVVERYTEILPGSSGSLTRAKAAQVKSRAGNPYDQAVRLQDDLQRLNYVTTIEGCGADNTPECLLRTEEGFCQQFASAMVMVLRELDIPSRLVNGYLPGGRQNGVWEVPMQALHSWVEVYFPGVGWVRFDPTPVADADRLNQSPTGFAPGAPIPTPGPETQPRPSPSALDADETFGPEPTLPPAGPVGPTVGDGDMTGGALSIAGLVVLALVALFVFVLLRLRRLPSADAGLAYRGIVSLASRLGFGPHPSQTEYEYASSLSESLPGVRDDLYLVADIRVASTYGQQQISDERMAALRRAYARIRTALIRLGLRRRG